MFLWQIPLWPELVFIGKLPRVIPQVGGDAREAAAQLLESLATQAA